MTAKSQNKAEKINNPTQFFYPDSDEEAATFGQGRYFFAGTDMIDVCDYDSDRDDRIPSDNSDETEPYLVETCYDSDNDSTSRRLKKRYLAQLREKQQETN